MSSSNHNINRIYGQNCINSSKIISLKFHNFGSTQEINLRFSPDLQWHGGHHGGDFSFGIAQITMVSTEISKNHPKPCLVHLDSIGISSEAKKLGIVGKPIHQGVYFGYS